MKIKRILTIVLLLSAVILPCVFATGCTKSSGQFKYKFDNELNGYRVVQYVDTRSATGFKEVTIPDTFENKPVVAISRSAFSQCSYLNKVNIGKNIQKIENYGISNNRYLHDIVVDSDNKNYASRDGILYSKDFKTLIAYPNAKGAEYDIDGNIMSAYTTVVIDNSVEKIGIGAFYKCDAIGSLTLGDNVREIGAQAFLSANNIEELNLNNGSLEKLCDNSLLGLSREEVVIGSDDKKKIGVRTVTLPSTIKVLEDGTFYGCKLLAEVNIDLRLSELSSVIFEEGWQPSAGGKNVENAVVKGLDFEMALDDFCKTYSTKPQN